MTFSSPTQAFADGPPDAAPMARALALAARGLFTTDPNPRVGCVLVSGGVVGAFSLLAINWALMRVLYRSPKVTAALEGDPSTLVRDGVVDEAELKRQSMTHEELVSVLNKNGFSDPSECESCVLEPNGTFFVKGKAPSTSQIERGEMMSMLEDLTSEVRSLRRQIEARG